MIKRDIESRDDIKQMVNTFYDQIKTDNLLGPIFNSVIKDNWSKHLEKMYGFWQSILFNTQTYNGSAFEPHGKLPISKEHFQAWLKLFEDNMDKQFEGPKAEEAKLRARKIGEIFYYKIEFNKGTISPEPL